MLILYAPQHERLLGPLLQPGVRVPVEIEPDAVVVDEEPLAEAATGLEVDGLVACDAD